MFIHVFPLDLKKERHFVEFHAARARPTNKCEIITDPATDYDNSGPCADRCHFESVSS